jgi:hypothetical protein
MSVNPSAAGLIQPQVVPAAKVPHCCKVGRARPCASGGAFGPKRPERLHRRVEGAKGGPVDRACQRQALQKLWRWRVQPPLGVQPGEGGIGSEQAENPFKPGNLCRSPRRDSPGIRVVQPDRGAGAKGDAGPDPLRPGKGGRRGKTGGGGDGQETAAVHHGYPPILSDSALRRFE